MAEKFLLKIKIFINIECISRAVKMYQECLLLIKISESRQYLKISLIILYFVLKIKYTSNILLMISRMTSPSAIFLMIYKTNFK